jgi:hypothetical protein
VQKFANSGGIDSRPAVMEILLHVQKIFEVEYVCMVDAEYRIAASVNTPHQGEIFNPAGIVAAAKARDAAVFTTTVLSYEDLLRERPPLFRDRESALDMAMVGESQPVFLAPVLPKVVTR